MLKILRAHKPGRLLFAILTLSISLAGVVANFSLAHNVMAAFHDQIDVSRKAVFLLRGSISNSKQASMGAFDGSTLESGLVFMLPELLPDTFKVFPVRMAQTIVSTELGQRPATVMQASRSFLKSVSAEPLPGREWHENSGVCLVGHALASRLPEVATAKMIVDQRVCHVLHSVEFPERPPFSSLNDSVIVAADIDEFSVGTRLNWGIFLSGPAKSLSEVELRYRLENILDLTWVDIWSGDAIAAQAERLVKLLQLFSNGLATVILLIGASSIASLMSFSVAERAREIAVKRTVGATRIQIVHEILNEALVIGFISVMLGTVLGYQLALHIQEPIKEFFPVVFSVKAAIWPLLKSIIGFLLVCSLAGIMPAWRASSLHPAQILRMS